MSQYDSLTTRMPNGQTNAAPWQTMGASGVDDPTWGAQFSDDFLPYIAANYTVTAVGTGTVAATPADGGAVLLTTTAGVADAEYLQLPAAGFKNTPGKAMFFKFKGTLSDVINCAFHSGLIITSATPQSATDGIFIFKPSGAATLQLVSKIGGVATTVNFPALEIPVAGVAFEVGFMVDYLGNIAGFFNPTTGSNPISAASAATGQARGPVAKIAAPSITTQLLNPSFGLLNASAAARTLTADFIVAIRER